MTSLRLLSCAFAAFCFVTAACRPHKLAGRIWRAEQRASQQREQARGQPPADHDSAR